MFNKEILILILINITHIISDPQDESDNTKILGTTDLVYSGGKFPFRYLVPDYVLPTLLDLDRYLTNLLRVTTYFNQSPNKTECNIALSVFLTKSLLKRTLLDYRSKLQSSHINLMSKIINEAENILSHYMYLLSSYDWTDVEYRLSRLFQNDEILVHNIGKFNRNRFDTWVLSNAYMNDFIEEIDEGTLPKEKYILLIQTMDDFYIGLGDSDECVSRVAYNREPIDFKATQPCHADDYCNHRLISSPSVAYALSHRFLNMFLRLKLRNCYIMSDKEDLEELDKMCAFMYRETVYLARRGYFVRDLFLEHITLCALMGYIEFHRLHWFNKALSWINKHDCVKEFRYFEVNRTRIERDMWRHDEKKRHEYLKWRCEYNYALCDLHQSALMMGVLGHAVRYVAHFMKVVKN